MFDDLKQKYMNNQLNKIKEEADVPLYSSEFGQEMLQRQNFLDVHDQYQERLDKAKEVMEIERSGLRRRAEEYQKQCVQLQL